MSSQTIGEPIRGLPRELGRDELVIGSDGRKALVGIPGAEGVHAAVGYSREGFEEGRWWIENRSESGTWLNGEPLAGRTPLSNGDRITVAGVDIRFSNGWLREDHSRAKGVRVDVRGVSDQRGGRTILRSVSFVANEGEFIGILGPSGCGKSSVIQRIAGLADFDSGSITVNGHPVSDDDKVLRRLIAYLPQNVEDSLHDRLTPREEMECARRIFLAPGDDDAALDSVTLTTLGLSEASQTLIGKLSGGQKRRVAIALALLRQPQLLLLDEPTAGLDPATETEVMDCLRRLSRQGRTVICATHVMENIALFDKVLVLTGGEVDNGRPVYFGSPKGVLEYFGVKSYPAMYAKLKDGSEVGKPVPDDVQTPEPWELPEPPPKASFWRSVWGYLRRSLTEFRAEIFHPRNLFDRVAPVPLRALFVQPLLIAVGLKTACAKMFAEEALGSGQGGDLSTVLFCAALSAFWLGLVGNVQSIVRERVPRRCLERLGGVSLARYGVAKLLAMIGPGAIQAWVFSALLFWLPEIGGGGEPSKLFASWGVIGVLWLVCLMGGMIGLAVSAVARSSLKAVGAVPVIAVLALFFSQPVIGFAMKERATDDRTAVKIADWMPCYRPQVYMCLLEDQSPVNDEEKPNAPYRFLGLFASYAVIAAAVSVVAQRRHERAWDGR